MAAKPKPIATVRPPPLDPRARDAFIRGELPDGPNHPGMVPTIPNHPEPSAKSSPSPPTARAAKGTKKLMRRAGGRTVRRLQVYLDPETAEALEQHCDTEGREISRVVDGAIRDYLTRKGAW